MNLLFFSFLIYISWISEKIVLLKHNFVGRHFMFSPSEQNLYFVDYLISWSGITSKTPKIGTQQQAMKPSYEVSLKLKNKCLPGTPSLLKLMLTYCLPASWGVKVILYTPVRSMSTELRRFPSLTMISNWPSPALVTSTDRKIIEFFTKCSL